MIKTLFLIAKKAIQEANHQLILNYDNNRESILSQDKDIKLKGDLTSEKIILSHLEKTEITILSEESGLKVADKHPGLRWIIDPIDGTMNYFKGFPICGVSIALWDQEKPLFGLVSDLFQQHLFFTAPNKEAYCDERLISVSSVTSKHEAVLCTGFTARTDFSDKNLKLFIDQIKQFKKIRMIGSAALAVCYVAAGYVDVYYEKDVMIWDVAAALAVLKSAGGKYQLAPTGKENCYHVYAGNGLIEF